MAVVTRIAGLVPLIGAVSAAVVLVGMAAVTAASADCADPGRYLARGEHLELVGGCLDPKDLPPAPLTPGHRQPAEPASLSP